MNKCKKFLVAVLTSSLLLNGIPTIALAQATPTPPSATCEQAGTGLVFFNGVGKTNAAAYASLHDIKRFYGAQGPNGKEISFHLAYNSTRGKLSDIAETFSQRLGELDAIYLGRVELFFSTINGGGDWLSKLGGVVSPGTFVTDFKSTVLAAYLDGLKQLQASPSPSAVLPTTSADYAQQRDLIDTLRTSQSNLLFVAHSQGNLFVNATYDYAVTKQDPASIKVVHIAPASVAFRSMDIFLADLDFVINGLRITFGDVTANTHHIPGYLLRPAGLNGSTDILGHGLAEIYLNTNMPGALGQPAIAPDIKQAMANALSALKPAIATGLRICGRVTWETGAPLEGATVNVVVAGKSVSAVSLSTGEYSLGLTSSQAAALPMAFVVSAYDSPDYNSDDATFNKTTASSILQNFVLKSVANNPKIFSLELVPQLHHLGDSSYAGTANSQFQYLSAEGISFTKSFSISPKQTTYSSAAISFKAKGVQDGDQLSINGGTWIIPASDPNGGYSDYSIPLGDTVANRLLKLTGNTIVINSVSTGLGDYDDFELIDVKLNFEF